MGRKRKAEPAPDPEFIEKKADMLRAFGPGDPSCYLVLSDLCRDYGHESMADRLKKAAAAVGKPGGLLLSLKCGTWDIHGVSFSPDGTRVAAGGAFHSVKIWDARTGEELLNPSVDTGHRTSVCFSPDGRRLALGGSSVVEVWDLVAGAVVFNADTGAGNEGNVCFSTDGTRVAGGGRESVYVWDAATGEEQLRIPTSSTGVPEGETFSTVEVQSVCFSPDGTHLAFGAGEEPLRICDARTGRVVWEATGTDRGSLSVHYAPDGRFVTVDWDQKVKVYDPSGDRVLLSLEGGGHPGTVRFSPDGRRLMSAGDHVLVWDAATGKPEKKWVSRGSTIQCADFAPDGRRVVGGNMDGAVKIWWVG